MPKRKKEPRNAYYFFMMQFRHDEEKKGRTFRNMSDVADAAAPKWKAMTAAQKAPFEELAKEAKLKDKSDLHNKFTSQGKSYAQVDREEKEKAENHKKMIQEIEQTIRMLDLPSGLLLRYPFYFAHVNIYCQREGTYYPCEIAVARFTLRKGVDETIHSLIDHDQVPPGYLFEAIKISEETHEIPVPPNGGEKNYYELLKNIRSFLMEGRDDNTLPPIYTHPVHIETVANVLDFLDSSTRVVYTDEPTFRVYPLTKLFFELRNACAHCVNQPGFPVETLAERELDKDMFNFTTGISCDFHEGRDSSQYCSLSVVKRWCFMFSDHCCQDVGVPLILGSHVPILSDTSRSFHQVKSKKSESSKNPSASGAIPKTKPQPATVTFVQPGSSGKETNNFVFSAAAETPVRTKGPAPPPLRQPNTMPQAIAGVLRKQEVKFTPEDFPAIGGRRGRGTTASCFTAGGSGFGFGKIPMAVAGRGRGAIPKENTTPLVGQGHGGLTEAMNGLKISDGET